MNWGLFLSLVSTVVRELPAAETVIADVMGTFNAASPLTSTPAVGASKTLMAIQRALNTYAKPSPLLDVDGLWGPATEAAVVKAFGMVGIAI